MEFLALDYEPYRLPANKKRTWGRSLKSSYEYANFKEG